MSVKIWILCSQILKSHILSSNRCNCMDSLRNWCDPAWEFECSGHCFLALVIHITFHSEGPTWTQTPSYLRALCPGPQSSVSSLCIGCSRCQHCQATLGGCWVCIPALPRAGGMRKMRSRKMEAVPQAGSCCHRCHCCWLLGSEVNHMATLRTQRAYEISI